MILIHIQLLRLQQFSIHLRDPAILKEDIKNYIFDYIDREFPDIKLMQVIIK